MGYLIILVISILLSIVVLLNDHKHDTEDLILNTAGSIIGELLVNWFFITGTLVIIYNLLKLAYSGLEVLI